MGIVTSTIYSTTAKEAMTQLNFSTDFQGKTASVTINLLKSGVVVKTETYNLDAENTIKQVSLTAPEMKSDGTVTLAANTNSVVFSGVCIWGDVVSFRAENVAVAYR
ncbi:MULTISPECIES: hypothetical protein [Tenacibaculum]|uniref:hypothetical protein n=1 Tax=Tenacibaculum TaxID=104267 RepID=UPI000DE9F260|nr:hypothetical protein [Tenacibaculum sp. E3R01]RBW62475.1 hypothetical protein DS884_02420 [Tenacibaculum sp. E3R01]